MRRWLHRIVLCLLLGAATTVLVAWALTVFMVDGELNTIRPPKQGDPTSLDQHDDAWRIALGRQHTSALPSASGPARPLESSTFRSRDKLWPGVDVHELYEDGVLANGGGTLVSRFAYRLSAGAPFRALSAEHFMPAGAMQAEYRFGIEVSRDVMWPNGQTRLLARPLPLRPVWPGFLLDVSLYTVCWLGLFLGISALWKAIRRRPLHCPDCRYDLRGNPDGQRGCPECGWMREAEGTE